MPVVGPRPSKALRVGVAIAGVVALIAVLGYGTLLAVLYFGQERFLFPGTTLPPDHRFAFAQPFEEVTIPVAGATLSALHFRQPEPRGLVFFIHGNAGNLESWTTGIDFYRRINYDLFIFDFRGYGKSTGRIESEAQLHADVRAAWNLIAPRYADLPIVVYGRSLGTPLAAELAREVDPALLVLVTPLSNLAAAANRRYPLAPDFLVRYPLRTDASIGAVRSPILILAGSDDTLTPPAEARRLQALARSPVELIVVQGAQHQDIHRFPAYLESLAERLAQVGTH
jgi:alpha-beta hydrolase superfamily lysophospholipase